MLLGTSCTEGTLHLEPELVHCEILDESSDAPAASGVPGRLVVTTLAVEGSPLVRLDTGDLVRPVPACPCGAARPGVVVLGRAADAVELGGGRLFPADLVDAAAAAADALDSSVFFVVVLPDRVLVRIERDTASGDPAAAFAARLPGVPVEIEPVEPQMLLDVELLARSPHVYKPVVLSDWRRPGRRVLTVGEGMIEWPRPSWAEGKRWLQRTFRTLARRRRLTREIGVAGPGRR
jgi:hypothetical protein